MTQAQHGQGKGQAPRRIIAALLAGTVALGVVAPLGLAPAPALAQNLFAPRMYVNDQVITEYEVIQRAMFLQVLRAPGDPQSEALKALVNERLQRSEAKRLGVTVTSEEVLQGMEEFASRANLTAEQLVGEFAKVGIAAETYRDFVTIGLMWRKVIRAKFLGQVPVSENEVDRALNAMSRPRALKVQVSEIVLPMEPGNEEATLALAGRLSEEIDTAGEFAAAARRHSAAATAGSGGAVPGWISLSNLPPAIASEILGLAEGHASAPVTVPNAVVLFLLRSVAEDETAEPISVSVEWADYYVADAAGVARVRSDADVCNDLYALAKGQPAEALTIRTQSVPEVPKDVALELARLDPGEISVRQTSSGGYRILMLCSRKPVQEPEPTRDQIREQVINQKLEGLANGYLEELRFAAVIREP